MKLYRLECLSEDGDIERNGYFFHRKNAENLKKEMDSWNRNVRYGIKQQIIEFETDDEL